MSHVVKKVPKGNGTLPKACWLLAPRNTMTKPLLGPFVPMTRMVPLADGQFIAEAPVAVRLDVLEESRHPVPQAASESGGFVLAVVESSASRK